MSNYALSGALLLLAAAPAAPANAQIPTKIYAQQLVDETVAKNPELLVVVMHVTPPKSAESVIVASNIGGIGKKTDADDLRVIQTNVPKRKLADGGTRFEVELPLSDTSGTTVGALDLVFPYAAGGDQTALQRKAERIRDGLSRRILNEANLMDPYPMDPLTSTKTRAQKLVDQAMARHPEVLSLAMHVTLPNSSDNVILGSSFGRIGKKADEDDMKVIVSGKTASGIYAAGKRFGLELVLQDVRGTTIGSLNVAYPYKAGGDELALRGAEKIRDELRAQIDSVEQLVALDP
ncbi:MAG: TonB-dependent siderophore receptor [Candidatus Eremiobacteraeota bacterium]|nr:TonB-dependent siderophore receptor [Candidatus Eremiobacteraeota bacterium]